MTTPGYSREFIEEREAEEAERRRQLEEQQRENARIRERYLKGLDDERAAKRAEHDAEIEASLAADKARAMRSWLAANPGRTEADFERLAWPHLKANLLEERQRQVFEATKAAMRASGKYSF